MTQANAARTLRDLADQQAGRANQPPLGLGRPETDALGRRSAAESFDFPRRATLGTNPWTLERPRVGASTDLGCGCEAATG